MRAFFFIVLMSVGFAPVFAFVPDERLARPEQEARAQALIDELRCFVCEGQPLAQSHVPLARDLRHFVRQQIAAGRSDEQILALLVKQYGRSILLNPPLNSQTLLLWSAPFFALVIGGVILWRLFFRGGVKFRP